MKNTAKHIAVNAIVAGLYVVLTMPFGTLSVNPVVQIRLGEALTILPCLLPYTAWGLAVGCAISNLVSSFGVLDVVLGSVITFISAICTAQFKKRFYLAPLPPILLNAIFLPVVWYFAGGGNWQLYFAQCLGLLVSQSIVLYALGIPLYFVSKKRLLPLIGE
ncbi:MAG: QueT transporter family protein [Clostridia bacterium]|nr:QueT transporter family protein [Clostridia bacterium]